jgi:CheY-like chemotaxis protein
MDKYILVVDDEQDIRGFLHDLLGDQGYSVRLAENGDEAMEMIQKEKPALILLDLMMPHGTGTDLYRRLHQHKEYKEIPVIIISGLPGRHLAVSKSVPVFDKPIDESKVLAEVKKAIG